MKHHPVAGGDSSLNDGLNLALEVQAAKVAASSPARLLEATIASMGPRPSLVKGRKNGQPPCWQCENAGHLRRYR